MRSLFALAAAAWFAWNAFTIEAFDVPHDNIAVTAARALFAGLVLISLSLVHWGAIWHQLKTFGN